MSVLPVENANFFLSDLNRNLIGKVLPFTHTPAQFGLRPGEPKDVISVSHSGPQLCTWESPGTWLKTPVPWTNSKAIWGEGGAGRTQIVVVCKTQQVLPLGSWGNESQSRRVRVLPGASSLEHHRLRTVALRVWSSDPQGQHCLGTGHNSVPDLLS